MSNKAPSDPDCVERLRMASKTFYECGCMEQGDQFFKCAACKKADAEEAAPLAFPPQAPLDLEKPRRRWTTRNYGDITRDVSALIAEIERLREALAASRPQEPALEDAFRAGYHCRWHKDTGSYCFDPVMSPGDPDGAFAAWLAAAPRALTPPAEPADLRQRLEEKA